MRHGGVRAVVRAPAARYHRRMAASTYIVLTAIGPDHPGLVDAVTSYVLESGGNLEDSRMVNLHGQFAMMLLVAGSTDTVAALRDGLPSLQERAGVHAQLQPATGAPATIAALPCRITAWAMDHPGLMQSVAHLLAGLHVNIESAETTLSSAPHTGTPLFTMQMVVSVPGSTPVAELREELGRLCDDLNIDWSLSAL
jgi:glycine cleavage system transcriptional repressor